MKISISILLLFIVFSLDGITQDFSHTVLEGHTSRVNNIVFSPDGNTLASTDSNRTIRLWDVTTGTPKHDLIGHDSDIYAIAFNSDGLTLASGSQNARIRLWDATTGQYRVTLEGHQSSISSVAFSPDGKILASGSSDRTIRLWDATTGFHNQTLTGHTESVYRISFIENGKTLASKSNDGTIRLWDPSTGQHKETISVNSFRNVAISLDKRMLAGVYDGNKISLWDIATESGIVTFTGHSSGIYAITFSPNSKLLASGGNDRTIRLWDLSTHVNLTPPSIEAPPVGDQFDININIVSGIDVRGFKITVEYDSDSLRYISHTEGEYLSDNIYKGPTVNQLGQISFNIVSTEGAGNGDGILAKIKFEVILRKASTISLSAVLSDSDGNKLPYIVISGKVVEPSWDINSDGFVDILDLSYVAARFGQKDQTEADINRDGVVDIKDLITVASGMDTETAAPEAFYRKQKDLPTKADVQKWLTAAQHVNLSDPTSQKGILFLELLLASLFPTETKLLPNFPNPFNPETWIPYQLAAPEVITISIFTMDGKVIRTLNLGQKSSGIYQDKTRAAYWDGKNDVGEPVASDVYFYTLTAGKFETTRKMLMLK